MTAALSDVVSGSVTTAVRDTTIDGLEIHENDNLGMVDGKILVSNPDMHQTLTETLKHMLDEDSEIVTSMSVKTEAKNLPMKLLKKSQKSSKTLKSRFTKVNNQFTHTYLVWNKINEGLRNQFFLLFSK